MATFQKNFVVKNGLEVGLNGGDILYASSGRVGVGSTQPTNTFDVTGSVGISSDLFVQRTSYITDIITNNNLSVSGLSTFVGNVQLRGNLEVQGTQLIVNTEEVRIEDKNITLGFSTQIAPSDFYASGGGFEIAGSVDTSILSGIGTNSAYKSFVWYDKAYPLFVSNQRVGIGTSVATNAAYLDVGGTVQFVTNENWDLRVDGRSKFTGYTEIDNLSFSGIASLSQISVGNSLGTEFQYIRKDSTNTGLEWASFPVLRTVESFTATPGQTIFTPSTSYNIGFIDVYINGVRLSNSEFIATNGTTVTLNAAAFSGDLVDLIIYAPEAGGVTSTVLLEELNWQPGQVVGGIYTSGVVSIGTSESYGTFSVDGTARFSGPVSIGTTASFPTTDLIVNDDSGYPNIWLTAGPDVAGADFRIGLTLADDGHAYLSTNDNIDLNFAVGGGVTSHVVIKEDGKVGIGSTLPDQVLDVNGNIKALGFIGDGSGLYNVGDTQWITNVSGVHTTANVGIGSTLPTVQLDVGGDVRIVGVLTVGSSSITIDGTNNLINVGTGVTIDGVAGIISATEIYANGIPLGGAKVTISETAPSAPLEGNLWYSSLAGRGFIWYNDGDSSQWVDFSPTPGSYINEESYWVSTAAGIHTLSNVGVGTTNPTTKLQVGGVLGFGADNNVRIGDNTTGVSLTNGADNTFIGAGAGRSTTSGSRNNFLGYNAGWGNQTGDDNNFFGLYAGQYNSRSRNNFFGYYAGRNNTGDDNNFLGYQAGAYNKQGFNNNFIGYRAGYLNDGGDGNNFIGRESGRANKTGNYNNFFGVSSGEYNESGSYNNFFGFRAGLINTTGTGNNFLGREAGSNNTTGSNNTYLGSFSGISTSSSNKIIFGRGFNSINLFDSPDTTKDTQFAVGVRTDANPANYWIVGNENFNVGIGTTNPTTKLQVGSVYNPQVIGFGTVQGYLYPGTNVLIGDTETGSSLTPQAGGAWRGLNNIFIGAGAGKSTTTGNGNNFFGLHAGYSNTSGYYNNFFGLYAGQSNTTGYSNNFFGSYGTGVNNTTGSNNNFLGNYAGRNNTTGSSNNFIGYEVGSNNTEGYDNNFIGNRSGYNNTNGDNNNFIGKRSGYYNTSGAYNNFFGAYAGLNNTTGRDNNFIGRSSGFNNTTGLYNLALGKLAGFGNQTGSLNVFLGSYTGVSTSASRKVIIGSGTNAQKFDAPDTNKDVQFAVGIKTTVSTVSKYWLVGDENFNVGIGTTNPTSKLTVQNGDIKVGVNTSNGVILTDSNGVAWRLLVNTDGTLATVAV